MDWLRSRIRDYSSQVMLVGKALFLAGSIMILAAVFARIALLTVNGERAEAKLPPLRTLAEAYPQYPTWLVPEGPVGFGIAAVLVLAGMVLAVQAEKAGRRGRR